MTRHFATLFDSAYLPKGLALHGSLLKHSSEPFVLHVLCMDMETFWILVEMKLQYVELIPLEAMERAFKLQPVRESRSWAEYCWTCASSFMEYLLGAVDALTYLDSDVFFFSDPKVIFDEIGEKSIGITPHRFSEKERARLGKNGEYNVGVVYAKNDGAGLDTVREWASQCRKWCFARNEDGKFGDQGYLDYWPIVYPNDVCIIRNLGVNLGPWAVGNFQVYYDDERGGPVMVDNDELVCYHFHEFQHAGQLTNWKLRDCDRELIYWPYVLEIGRVRGLITAARFVRQSRPEPSIA